MELSPNSSKQLSSELTPPCEALTLLAGLPKQQDEQFISFLEAPLLTLLETPLEAMTHEQQLEYVTRIRTLRTSAQTLKAHLEEDAESVKKPRAKRAPAVSSNLSSLLLNLDNEDEETETPGSAPSGV